MAPRAAGPVDVAAHPPNHTAHAIRLPLPYACRFFTGPSLFAPYKFRRQLTRLVHATIIAVFMPSYHPVRKTATVYRFVGRLMVTHCVTMFTKNLLPGLTPGASDVTCHTKVNWHTEVLIGRAANSYRPRR